MDAQLRERAELQRQTETKLAVISYKLKKGFSVTIAPRLEYPNRYGYSRDRN